MIFIRPLTIFAALALWSAAAPEAAEKGAAPASIATAPAPAADAVPYPKLGWAESKFTWEGKPFSGTTEEAWKKTGKLKLRYQIKDGVYHGLVEEWYENGNKKTQTRYQNGKHEGDNFYWNSDGSLQVHKVWKDDKLISETPGAKKP